MDTMSDSALVIVAIIGIFGAFFVAYVIAYAIAYSDDECDDSF